MNRRVSLFRSKRLKDKKRKHFIYKYVGGILFLVIAVLVLSFLSRASFARVEKVVIEGNKIVQTEALEEIVNNTLKSSYLRLFSKNNVALYPRSEVEKRIYEQFATIGAASVSFEGLKTILVKVREYEPEFLWCSSVNRERCYLMDSNGFVFSEAADFSENVLFTYYGLIDPSQPIGKTFIAKEKFEQINSFIDSLKLLKLTAVGLNARTEEDFEIYLSTGGSILFSNQEEVLTTFENLETIINEQTQKNKNFLSELEYIDVRFSSKAFVKLK